MVFVLDPFYAASYWSSVNADKWPLYFGFVFLPSDPNSSFPPKEFLKRNCAPGWKSVFALGDGGKGADSDKEQCVCALIRRRRGRAKNSADKALIAKCFSRYLSISLGSPQGDWRCEICQSLKLLKVCCL